MKTLDNDLKKLLKRNLKLHQENRRLFAELKKRIARLDKTNPQLKAKRVKARKAVVPRVIPRGHEDKT